MKIKNDITGIILAGGKSSRMGTDKGLILYKGEPFVQYSINALRPIVDDIIIVTNNSSYDTFNQRRVSDIIEDAGPLSGVYSGLKHSNTAYNLILSCDIPLIKTAILEKIIHHIDDYYDIIQIKSNGRVMPLIAFYNKRCEDQLLKLLNAGVRRMSKTLEVFKVSTLELPIELDSYTANINTPTEFKAIINEPYN